MAGMKFEYDENGGKFYYFLLSFYAMVLAPATYYLWPEKREKSRLSSVCCGAIDGLRDVSCALKESKSHPEDTSSYGPCRVKYQLLNANEPFRRKKQQIT
jgi:hypothetical protein